MKIQSNWVIKYRKKCSKTYIYEGNFSNYFELPPNFVLQTCFTTDSRENQVICLDNSSFSERNGVSFKIGEPILQLYCLTTTQRYYLRTYYGSLLWKKHGFSGLQVICFELKKIYLVMLSRLCFKVSNIISKLAPQISKSLHHFCLWETEWVYKTKKKEMNWIELNISWNFL